MDLETENRIAAILLKEAAELRRQAQSEGALAYLRQPTVRGRPNSRFLTATVRGVQQANRVVEVNEMWRLKEKQLELDHRLRGSRSETSIRRGHNDVIESHRSRSRDGNEVEASANATHLSKKRTIHDLHPMEDEGLKDDEVDEFLHSRIKRGRGAVGSRMDETGPYLPSTPDSKRYVSASSDEDPKKARVLLGPEKPYSLKPKKHILKDKSRDKKKKRNKEKKSKHRR